ncbi:MAG TPA: NAD(P)H-dependent glycerol-3-phosphate dehydrogenase [Usitatibacter sp.]|nr:NAD(P)H-dependent glycerol-3-phosphate dehydrogenase [Usitatibacter sp.]
MARVTVIGGGAFGTAMACVTRRSGNDVMLWALEPEVVDAVNRSRTNPQFLAGVDLPGGIRATGDLALSVAEADFVLLAVPAQHMRTIAGALRPHLRRRMTVASCAKGIERESGLLMPEVLSDMLPDSVISVMSGPSFAAEIARDLPCGVVLACSEWEEAETMARHISNRHFCVHLSDDVVGAAIAGAMKNVVSIASGIVHGLKLGENARATIMALGLAEAERLALVKGGRRDTFAGLAGAGDFMLTGGSLQSRNTSLGVALGEGKRLDEILAGRKQVTEGVATIGAVAALARRLRVEMPIVEALDAVLNQGRTLDEGIAQLMASLPSLCRIGPPAKAA